LLERRRKERSELRGVPYLMHPEKVVPMGTFVFVERVEVVTPE